MRSQRSMMIFLITHHTLVSLCAAASEGISLAIHRNQRQLAIFCKGLKGKKKRRRWLSSPCTFVALAEDSATLCAASQTSHGSLT